MAGQEHVVGHCQRPGGFHLSAGSNIVFLFTCNAAFAHVILHDKLHVFGIHLGSVLCVVGSNYYCFACSTGMNVTSLVWNLATEPVMFFGSHN